MSAPVDDLEQHHRRIVARELAAAAGVPLRDRYGFAARDEEVDIVLAAMFDHPDDVAAAAVAMGDALLAYPLAMGSDMPTDEEYERRIAAAVHPLVADRNRAAARSGGVL